MSSGGSSSQDDGLIDWSSMSLSSSNFSIGGGRVDGSFNHHHTTSSWGESYPFPPPMPPPPQEGGGVLLDQTEQSLFSTFLTTLDIDPKFLFNPILPPGMPSPPSYLERPGREDEWKESKTERELLGDQLERGLGINTSKQDIAMEEEEEDGKDSDYSIPQTQTQTSRSKRARPPSTATSSRRNSNSSGTLTSSSKVSLSKKPLSNSNSIQQLTQTQKRQNHIESEQRRRNAIKLNFKDLVELVIKGQSLSGVILGADVPSQEEENSEDDEVESGSTTTARGKKGKKGGGRGKGKQVTARGRGRKGDTGANASKSVVLERARDYICWLERGNRALEREIQTVEELLDRSG